MGKRAGGGRCLIFCRYLPLRVFSRIWLKEQKEKLVSHKKHCNITLCWEHSFTKEEKSPHLTNADCKVFLNCALRQMIAIAM